MWKEDNYIHLELEVLAKLDVGIFIQGAVGILLNREMTR